MRTASINQTEHTSYSAVPHVPYYLVAIPLEAQ